MADSDQRTSATPTDPGPYRLRYAAVSDLGRHRKDNQDSGYAGPHLLMVADGVGGAAYGDVASATAVHLLRRLDVPPTNEVLPVLAGTIHRVHDRLAELVEQDHELDGTSTTLTAAVFDGAELHVAHVGDSRAYLLRDGAITQLTADHTFVQTLVDEGRITEEQSRVHPHRNIILRAVDATHETDPDLFRVPLQEGDRVMLCSDGCSGAVTDSQIAEILGSGSVDSTAVDLVQAALDNGTTDNVTVIVAEVVPVGAPAEDDETSAMVATGPMLVGAAAAQPRRGGMLGRALFRHRQADTGELEPVPAEPVDPEELRYAPRAPRRFRTVRRVLAVLVPLALVGGLLAGGYAWSQRQYFVADDGEYVAIYRGVQLDLPGVDLASVYETDTLRVSDLSTFNQDKVEAGIAADSLADARRILAELSEQVVCPPVTAPTPTFTASPSPRGSGTPAPTPTPSPTPAPTPSPAPTPGDPCATATPTPTPTPTPTASPQRNPTRAPASPAVATEPAR